jgi:NAD(P)-dependent dehydrogenase (short-subunit alcohol dehydrogenase family)
MLLENKTAVVYGGGGAIGGAVARTFAREGARVVVAGRTRRKLDRVVADIVAAGGTAEAVELDVLDAASVDSVTDAIAQNAGGSIDIAFNATGFVHVQGKPLAELSLAEFEHPVHAYIRSNYLTAKAAARHMAAQRRGVILMVTTPVARMPGPGFMGHCVALAGVEAMTRHLAGELGEFGVRVACIRSHAIADAIAPELESSSREVFAQMADPAGMTLEEMLEAAVPSTLLRRLPRLDDVASAAAFLASDRAGATTGAIMNLTGGMVLDL